MSKSIKYDNNISHNEEWDIVKNKLELLLETKDWKKSMREIFFLINNEKSNFSKNNFIEIFSEFSKKINFVKEDKK